MKEGDNEFKVPLDCLPGVGEVWSGQYDFPAQVNGPCLVLDIGANCGAYALRARRLWPECCVIAYEPHPDIYGRYLLPNTLSDARITCHQLAVGDPGLTGLHIGLDTRLCSSTYDLGRQGAKTVKVGVLAPHNLPRANVIKIDTEGAEGYIVEHLVYMPDLLVVEYHSEELRHRVEASLRGHMILIGAQINGLGWGHLQYKRTLSSGGAQ